MQPIHLRNVPPPAETYDHVSLLSHMASWIKPERYLELGVRDGKNFVHVSQYCKHAIGVDVNDIPFLLHGNMEFRKMTTDQYFEQLVVENDEPLFDMVFIDADHSHEQSLKDFLNVEKYVIEDGLIFFHDTYPFDPEYFHPGACNDVYKTALYIKQNLIDRFEIVTLPFNPGVTIVKKISRNKQLIYL